MLARHQCLIYSGSPAKQLASLAVSILSKLNSRHRCLVLNNPAMLTELRAYLKAAGVDVDREIQRSAMALSSDRSHLVNGRFDPDKMLEALNTAVDAALREGYLGLWATGDMTWEFGAESNFDALLRYEFGLEKLFRMQPALSGLCQYHRDTVPPHALHTALRTHKALYINETLSRMNPDWVSFDSPEAWNQDLAMVRLDQFVRDSGK